MLNTFNTCCRSLIAILAKAILNARAVLATLIVISAMLMPQSASADNFIIYVDDSAPAAGDGAGWSTAYRVLQDALAEALYLTTVISGHADNTVRINVAAGTYYPDRFEDATSGNNDRTATFNLLQRVSKSGTVTIIRLRSA